MTGRELLLGLEALSSEELDLPVLVGKYHSVDMTGPGHYEMTGVDTILVGNSTQEYQNDEDNRYCRYYYSNIKAINIL